MRPAIILLFILANFVGEAKSLQWYEAVVVLKDNQVLVGEVVVQPALDVVLFKSHEMRAFYPAAEINYINIHDNNVKVPRKFISLSSEERGRAVNKIYEVVLQGELSVIRKPRGGSLPDFDDVYSYEYFVMESSTVVKLADFRKTIYPIIENHYSPKQMMKFLNDENLNPWSPADAIKLIDIYNDRLPIDAANISARR